jgi:peptidoglycan/LPS O-acetylase OafA/YrhL
VQAVESPSGTRNATLDGLKYVAATGIVLHHVAAVSGSGLGRFLTASPLWALFFFFAASGYFHGPLGDRGPAWLRRRFVRLVVPYAAWSAVYLVWGQRHLLEGGEAFVPGVIDVVFFAGAHGILWSLPMLLACAVLAELLVRTKTQRRIAIAVCVAATLALYWLAPPGAIAGNSLQNFILAPRWILAYVGGMAIRDGAAEKVPARLMAVLAPLTMLAAGGVGLITDRLDPALAASAETGLWVAGALLVLGGAASGVTWFGAGRLAWGREYLLGVYVSHVLWFAIFAKVVPPGTLPDALWIAVAWTVSLLASTLTVAVLRSNRLTRPMVT